MSKNYPDITLNGVTHHKERLNGVELHCVEKRNGPLVLLMHGFPEFCWSRDMRDLIDYLGSPAYVVGHDWGSAPPPTSLPRIGPVGLGNLYPKRPAS